MYISQIKLRNPVENLETLWRMQCFSKKDYTQVLVQLFNFTGWIGIF